MKFPEMIVSETMKMVDDDVIVLKVFSFLLKKGFVFITIPIFHL